MGKSGMAYGRSKEVLFSSLFSLSLEFIQFILFLSSQNLRLKLPLKKEAH